MGELAQPVEPLPPGGPAGQDEEAAGDPACLAHLVCPACGGVLSEGHQPGCRDA